MNDIVTRLRDWRNVHLARLHLLMDEAADEMARLHSDNSRRANLEKGLRDGIVRLRLTDVERAAVQRAVQDESEHGLVYTADRLQSLLDRLPGSGDCPAPDNAANGDNNERLAALQALAAVDEELCLPRRTPASHATSGEGSEQSECTLNDEGRVSLQSEIPAIDENPSAATLTDVEREAIESAIWDYEQNDDDEDCARMVSTLESLLERMA